MTIASFDDLCHGLCELAGLKPPRLDERDDGYAAFTVTLQGVAITVACAPAEHSGGATLFVDFGEVPAQREAQAIGSLLESNYQLMKGDDWRFARDPVSRRIVLQHYMSFDEATPVDLYQRMVELSGQAMRWRQGGEQAQSPPALERRLHDFALRG